MWCISTYMIFILGRDRVLRMNYKTSEEQYYRQYEQNLKAADSDATNNGIYMDKANDAMKKLEALQ